MITRVRVDEAQFKKLGTPEANFSVHFNCFDENDASLPGLGGRHYSSIAEARQEWRDAGMALCALAHGIAVKWIRLADDYTDDTVGLTITHAHVRRYRSRLPGSHGISFNFQRDDDVFPSALLLTHRNRERQRIGHNDKRYIENAEMTADLDADIEAIMTQAEEVVFAVNQTRTITRVVKAWQRT